MCCQIVLPHQRSQIKNEALLVLEENQILKEHMELKEKQFVDMEKNHINEVGRLSKRIIISESEKVNLLNQLDLYKENHDELLKKYNDASVEANRRVSLEEHLIQTSELKRKIEELSLNHKQELEKNLLLIQVIVDKIWIDVRLHVILKHLLR